MLILGNMAFFHFLFKIRVFLVPFLLIGSLQAFGFPYILDENYEVEKYVSGLTWPTTMSFLGDDILVLEKTTGDVRLIRNGILQKEHVLHVDVDPRGESGLLGITTKDSSVYIYFTASEKHGETGYANHIYKYNWDGQKLQNGVLVKELPFNQQGARHNGGVMVTHNDGTIFAVKGDGGAKGKLQNLETGEIDDNGMILIVNHEESVLRPHESDRATEHYYAMGIRNSFGLAIDPITGFLWDTENGPIDFDEVNLVMPKFNSGWRKIMGPATQEQLESLTPFHDFQYSDPEFSWQNTVAPTGITFVNSDSFNDYKNSLFVAAANTGSIYKFKLNAERTGFIFEDPSYSDLVLNYDDGFGEITWGAGFGGGLTDLKFGPDGNLYTVAIGAGSIWKISPVEKKNNRF